VRAKLQESLGQSFVIDNKPGANGALGGKFVANAQPDGYTLFVGSIGVFAINPVLYKDLGYDPLKDYDLLSVAVRTPNALVTRANFPANNVKEFVDYVRRTRQGVVRLVGHRLLRPPHRARSSGRRPAPPASTCPTRAAAPRTWTSSPATPTPRSRTWARSRST
jgi:hypothetical protein